jgi:acylphosphatase
MYERLEAVVSGKVQGVLYRDYICRKATQLHLAGAIQNLSDGTVSVIAEGPRPLLDKLIEQLHVGSLQSEVKSVEIEWYPITYEYKTFDVYE